MEPISPLVAEAQTSANKLRAREAIQGHLQLICTCSEGVAYRKAARAYDASVEWLRITLLKDEVPPSPDVLDGLALDAKEAYAVMEAAYKKMSKTELFQELCVYAAVCGVQVMSLIKGY